jgi:hypothetical protein
MIVNATDRYLIFKSGTLRDQTVVPHRAGAIVAGTFTATDPRGSTVLVKGQCKPGDRLKVVETSGRFEATPVVFVKNKANETPSKVAEYLNRAYKLDKKASDLCLRKPAFASELLIVGFTNESPDLCSKWRVLAQDATGLMSVDEGGYSWPEPFIDAHVARGGTDAERATAAWTREVEWTFTPLETAPASFASEHASKFFAPRTSTQGDQVWVEAWRQHFFKNRCYVHARRIHNAAKHEFSEIEVATMCVEGKPVSK